MQNAFQPQIILLKEGTDTSQGKSQIVSNINACQAVAETVKTTLGPRGMDKLIFDGKSTTISNDGATIMKLLDIVHPAAKTLVDISMAQDAEVGDGTTSVVVLAAEMLKEVKQFIEDGLHPRTVIRGLRQSKLIANQKGMFAPMVVDAVLSLQGGAFTDIRMVGIKKVTGGSVTDSHLVDGVAFKKTFSYAGFEQQPKHLQNPKILVLNVELELKSEKENAEVRITDPDDYQSIVDAEWRIIYEKLENCVATTGAQMQTSINGVGEERMNFFREQFLEETHRSIHDALMIVKRSLINREVVAGGGAIEMELSSILRAHSKTILGKQQLIMESFARALEVIPHQVAANAGLDSTDVLNNLRNAHFVPNGASKWYGVDVFNEGICDTFESGVWEPAANKLNSLASACEAACCILSIDETVKNPQSEKPQGPSQGMQQAGRQMVSQGMGGSGLAGMAQGAAKGALRSFKGRGGA
eukprot:GSChrysophyteH1.ASY1.ANO1.2001.1 assembled CDS